MLPVIPPTQLTPTALAFPRFGNAGTDFNGKLRSFRLWKNVDLSHFKGGSETCHLEACITVMFARSYTRICHRNHCNLILNKTELKLQLSSCSYTSTGGDSIAHYTSSVYYR